MNDKEFIMNYKGPPIRIMEVCGTHTSAIFRSGIRSFLSPDIKLVSGPGCPVCVTTPDYIDRCIGVSLTPGYEIICFGDLLKIPGTNMTLSDAKGAGGRVRMAWSPFDVIALAVQDPDTVFVVAAIGFETTAPAFGLLIGEAAELGLGNIKLLTSLKSALAAIEWICDLGEDIDAFICPGHVSVITGADAYLPLAEKYHKPFIVAGFEGEQLISAIRAAVESTSAWTGSAEKTFIDSALAGRGCVRNLYTEAVSDEGNKRARGVIDRYFDLEGAVWRGLGYVDKSGYYLRDEYRAYDLPDNGFAGPAQMNGDAASGMALNGRTVKSGDEAGALPDRCRCGDVILGRIDPPDCPLFGKTCLPAGAVGPCMVSAEGACGCWYRGRQHVVSSG